MRNISLDRRVLTISLTQNCNWFFILDFELFDMLLCFFIFHMVEKKLVDIKACHRIWYVILHKHFRLILHAWGGQGNNIHNHSLFYFLSSSRLFISLLFSFLPSQLTPPYFLTTLFWPFHYYHGCMISLLISDYLNRCTILRKARWPNFYHIVVSFKVSNWSATPKQKLIKCFFL